LGRGVQKDRNAVRAERADRPGAGVQLRIRKDERGFRGRKRWLDRSSPPQTNDLALHGSNRWERDFMWANRLRGTRKRIPSGAGVWRTRSGSRATGARRHLAQFWVNPGQIHSSMAGETASFPGPWRRPPERRGYLSRNRRGLADTRIEAISRSS